MNSVLPILSGKEDSPKFLEKVILDSDKVVLLIVVDKDFMDKASTTMSEIRHYRVTVENIKKVLIKKGKKIEEVTEWGSTLNKILSTSFFHNAEKVFLVNQDTAFFREVVSGIEKEGLEVNTMVID